MTTPLTSHLMRAARAIDWLSEWSGRAVSWLALLMVIATFLVVVLRYLFNIGWIAMQESILYMHSAVFLIGAAYTLKYDGHVRVDIFYQRMTARGRAWVDLMGVLLLLLPTFAFLFWVSWEYVVASWSLREDSREAGGIPFVYGLKTLILVMAGLMLMQGIGQALHSLLILLDHSQAEEH